MNAPTKVAIAVVQQDDQVLVGPRPDDVPLGGYWEFPGGKISDGETPADAAVRECYEETGVQVEVVSELAMERFDYPHDCVELYFFRCRPRPQTVAHAPFRWVACRDLKTLSFPPANDSVIKYLVELDRHAN